MAKSSEGKFAPMGTSSAEAEAPWKYTSMLDFFIVFPSGEVENKGLSDNSG